MQIYVVASGDTVYGIARKYRISPDEIIEINQLESPFGLAVGQALLLPAGTAPEKPDILVSGYAYPYINSMTLMETLPYLSRLLVFSYGFTTEGQLLAPAGDDLSMIQASLNANVDPFLVLTPLGPNGNFDNRLISSVVRNEEYANRLIREVIETLRQKSYRGVDIDFEYILAGDRIPFADFVRKMHRAVNEAGFPLSIALAPKTSDDQKGTLYEGKDYRLLGESADQVFLMTYEWGYTYGPPMAVAPLNQVRRVVEYALSRIPAEKIMLGIPNYGYDWPLPYVRGESAAKNIGNASAPALAVRYGAEIFFDTAAQSPYFRYSENGRLHEVWFEDPRSYEAKFNLVKEYKLSGLGYWQIMRLFRAGLFLQNDRFSPRR